MHDPWPLTCGVFGSPGTPRPSRTRWRWRVWPDPFGKDWTAEHLQHSFRKLHIATVAIISYPFKIHLSSTDIFIYYITLWYYNPWIIKPRGSWRRTAYIIILLKGWNRDKKKRIDLDTNGFIRTLLERLCKKLSEEREGEKKKALVLECVQNYIQEH